jgi:hypothetical protein
MPAEIEPWKPKLRLKAMIRVRGSDAKMSFKANKVLSVDPLSI